MGGAPAAGAGQAASRAGAGPVGTLAPHPSGGAPGPVLPVELDGVSPGFGVRAARGLGAGQMRGNLPAGKLQPNFGAVYHFLGTLFDGKGAGIRGNLQRIASLPALERETAWMLMQNLAVNLQRPELWHDQLSASSKLEPALETSVDGPVPLEQWNQPAQV